MPNQHEERVPLRISDSDRAALEQKIGYTFENPELLCEALTHASYANEQYGNGRHNERLEFLGDAVFQLVVSRYLYCRYPDEPEGELSRYRQNLVCDETLARLAERLGLGDFLLLGRGEEKQGGRKRKSTLANAMEAVAAAIFLDAGEETAGRTSVCLLSLLKDELASCDKWRGGDYKTRLQQFVEQDGKEQLHYRVLSCEGPAHAPTFTVEALLNSNVIGKGSGGSKQEAEEQAAYEALFLFGLKNA